MNSSPGILSFWTLSALLGGDAAAEVDEPGVASASLRSSLSSGTPISGASSRRGLRRVLDQVRRGGDVDRGLGDREVDAVDVGDRAAPRGDRDVGLLLGDRGALERAGLDHAEPRGLGRADREQDEEDGEEEPDAPLDELHAPSPAARRSRRCRASVVTGGRRGGDGRRGRGRGRGRAGVAAAAPSARRRAGAAAASCAGDAAAVPARRRDGRAASPSLAMIAIARSLGGLHAPRRAGAGRSRACAVR